MSLRLGGKLPRSTMDETQQPSQLRSVNEVLRPITPIKRSPSSSKTSSPAKKRQRLNIAPCPICKTKMSTLMIPFHIDTCKPRRIKPPKPKPKPPELHLIFKAPPVTATISNKPPQAKSHTFTATINLRSFDPPTVLHLHATTPPPHPIPLLAKNTPASRLPLSLLKSALQKSVRRNRPWPALRIAIVLLRRRATFELLRRLTVIILEDATLHPAYPSLIFLLTASSKDHVLSYAEIVHLLKVVYDVAAVTSSDPLPDAIHETTSEQQHQLDLVTSLRIRTAYGGMQPDKDLLQLAADTWLTRSTTPNWRSRFDVYHLKSSENEVTVQRVAPWLRADDPVLRPGDIPLEAWDFHCCSVADDIVQDITTGRLKGRVPRFEKLSRARDVSGVFKGLMWRFWSGVSYKKPLKLRMNVQQATGRKSGEESGVYDVNPKVIGDAQCEEEIVWKEELCGPVMDWCKTYRKRYGL